MSRAISHPMSDASQHKASACLPQTMRNIWRYAIHPTKAMGLFACIALFAGCHSAQSVDCKPFCECFEAADCGVAEICFLGSCRPPGDNIATVYADLSPSRESEFQAQPDPMGARNLGDGLNLELEVQRSIQVEGRIVQADGTPISGTLDAIRIMSFSQGPRLPSLTQTTIADLDPSGYFQMRIPPGRYDLYIMPEQRTLPYILFQNQEFQTSGMRSLQYPSQSEWVVMRGNLRNATGDAPLAGLWVWGVADPSSQTSEQEREVQSVHVQTDGAGDFSLVFPPRVDTFALQIQNSQSQSQVFLTCNNPSSIGSLGDIRLLAPLNVPLPLSEASIRIQTTDLNGASLPQIELQIEGMPDLGDMDSSGCTLQATLTALLQTDAEGVANLQLPAGTYRLHGTPDSNTPYAIASSDFCVAIEPSPQSSCLQDGAAIALKMPAKIHVAGIVRSHDQAAVSNAQITFTHTDPQGSGRTFVGQTDLQGMFSLDVDPGLVDAPRTYEVWVLPNQASGQTGGEPIPRHRELRRIVGDVSDLQIQLFAPSFVFGSVRSDAGEGVADVVIGLYSEAKDMRDNPLLLGRGQTDDAGAFVIPLPTPSLPSVELFSQSF